MICNKQQIIVNSGENSNNLHVNWLGFSNKLRSSNGKTHIFSFLWNNNMFWWLFILVYSSNNNWIRAFSDYADFINNFKFSSFIGFLVNDCLIYLSPKVSRTSSYA